MKQMIKQIGAIGNIVPELKNQYLYNLKQFNIPVTQETLAIRWLDLTQPQQKNFAEVFGEKVVGQKDEYLHYYGISETAMSKAIQASNSVHEMFLKATEKVLEDDNLLEKFDIPKEFWPKIRKSWKQPGNPRNIHGRIDFSVSDQGVKVYEYNADSSSLLMECVFSQGKWCEAVEIRSGKDAGANAQNILRKIWSQVNSDLIFIFRDARDEEYYHDLLMKKLIEQTGKRAKIITNLEELHINQDGTIIDKDGEQVKTVWKSWNWETILNEYKEDMSKKNLNGYTKNQLKLYDIMLNQKVFVYQPLWTAITANKTILPIISKMYPQNEYILQASYQLTQNMKNKGYIKKPVRGRCGLNAEIVSAQGEVMEKSEGNFNLEKIIYQQLFLLPIIGSRAVQLHTFMVNGTYVGAGVRTDPTFIINYQSLVFALRVLPDKDFEPQNEI